MSKKIFLLGSAALIISAPAMAQSYKLKQANKMYKNRSYASAIGKYESYLKGDSNNVEAIRNLAHSYRHVNNWKGAERYFSKVVQFSDHTPDETYYYAQALQERGKTEQAIKLVQQYRKEAPSDKRGENMLQGLQNQKQMMKDSNLFYIKKLELNSPGTDMTPVVYRSGIVFASTRETYSPLAYKHTWTQNYFLSLYFARKKDSTHFGPARVFSNGVKSRYNDGPVCFSENYKDMYITRNNVEKGKASKAKDQQVKLKIIRARVQREYDGNEEKNDFKIKESLPFNSEEYNCAHPSLSFDGTILYFASDMPGGMGGYDIWYAEKDTSGNGWKKPVNLGEGVNTSGDEVFPTVFADGTLYFASSGQPGLGGLDIFYSVQEKGDKYSKAVNMGYPINSFGDDFGLYLEENGTTGYFTSNRGNGGINDDIYYFRSYKPRRSTYYLSAADVITGDALDKISFSVKEKKSGEAQQIKSENGLVAVELYPDREYIIETKGAGYGTYEMPVTPKPTNQNISIKLNKEQSFSLNIMVFNNPRDKKPVGNAVVSIQKGSNTPEQVTANGSGFVPTRELAGETDYLLQAFADGKTSEFVKISTKGLSGVQILDAILYLEK